MGIEPGPFPWRAGVILDYIMNSIYVTCISVPYGQKVWIDIFKPKLAIHEQKVTDANEKKTTNLGNVKSSAEKE